MSDLWQDEVHDGNTRLGLRVKSRLFEEQSPFQHIEIIDTYSFGRVLIIDDVFMTSEYDEFLYHEMLVHPAMVSAPDIARVLVIGGGDGGTVREVLRHPDVESVVMIEIDEAVVRACKTHLPTIGSAWDDPRLDVRFIDGIDYVKNSSDAPYDVVLLDGTDPVGPGAVLFDRAFFEGCKRMLKPEGILAIQSESPLLMMDVFTETQHKLRALFNHVHPYFGPVPLYGTGVWSWTWCADQGDPHNVVTARQSSIAKTCRAYNEKVHTSAFTQPNYVRQALD